MNGESYTPICEPRRSDQGSNSIPYVRGAQEKMKGVTTLHSRIARLKENSQLFYLLENIQLEKTTIFEQIFV